MAWGAARFREFLLSTSCWIVTLPIFLVLLELSDPRVESRATGASGP